MMDYYRNVIKEYIKENVIFFIILFTLIYEELVFKLLLSLEFNLSFLLYVLGISICLYVVIRLFKEKISRILFLVVLGIILFLFSLQLCMFKMYNFFFDFGLLSAADQIGTFYKDIFNLIFTNLLSLIVIWLPFILLIKFNKKLVFNKLDDKRYVIIPCAIALGFICFVTPENITTDKAIISNGVLTTFINDFKEKKEVELVVNIESEEVAKEIVEEKVPVYHEYNIDFNNATSNNSSINTLNEYFSSQRGEIENEYTGLFKGKNLVLILGESFNDIAIKKDLTPNLYKMVNEGFEFSNYYSTSYNSTLGGEFQLLTGMYAISGALETWKAGTSYFPLSPGYMFKDAGYSTFAYHDHDYSYMDRNNYEPAAGFDNFMGCGNGLEDKMSCYKWFESDEEMATGTVNDYISKDKFFTYYVTVSGHGPYGYSDEANRICHKYLDLIKEKGYDYSEKVMCYESTMIELDNMLGIIMKELEAKGKLEDTVFVIAGDHYPYYLNEYQIAELCGEVRESIVGVCKNSLIIYNAGQEKIKCDKAGNTMDVIATIYNLFGLDYDSRLIPGKDLLSDSPGFAIFGNGSWVSDKGIYYAHLSEFVPNDGVTVSDDYFKSANSYVSSRMALTNKIVNNDYYRYIWDYKK